MTSAASRAAAARVFGGSTTDATSGFKKKKLWYAAEQKRADVAHASRRGCASKGMFDPRGWCSLTKHE